MSARCCLLDKRWMRVAPSSWTACVRCRRIFFLFAVEQFVSTSTGTERPELRCFCHQSYAERLADLHYNGFLLSSVIGVWSPMVTCILQTNDLLFHTEMKDLWTEGRAAVWPSIYCNLVNNGFLFLFLFFFLMITFKWGMRPSDVWLVGWIV